LGEAVTVTLWNQVAPARQFAHACVSEQPQWFLQDSKLEHMQQES
jgi:hypothetical protein